MHWIDWLITIIPVLFVLGLAVYCRRYVRGVADYLAAGRVAGRYLMCVAGLESALGVTMVVATSEAKYKTGFAMDFWQNLSLPVFMIMGLTGFCFYRFRETKALSMGQFLEVRYSKSFRVFAATVRTTAEMACNAIGPAITANFFIYFLGIPHRFVVAGVTIPTFSIVVGSVLVMAIVIMWYGGRLSLMVTDTVLGLMSYPIFVLITVYVIWHFSWSGQIAPTMSDRVAGEDFLNPFKMQDMRDFNTFAVAVGIFSALMNRAVWVGNDGTNAGRTPHEQKMAGILATWRQGFSGLLTLMIAVAVITLMGHRDFATDAKDVRVNVTRMVADEVVPNKEMQARLVTRMQEIPVTEHRIGIDPPYSEKQNADTPYMEAAHDVLGRDGKGNATYQNFESLYRSMMMPLALRKLLPVGMTGLFCLMMLMMFLATDTSRMFNSSSTLIQDIVLPMKKKELTREQHVQWLRWGAVGVALAFFVASMLFRQMDFIWMFQTIVLSIWLGGAGVMMIGGLYTRFGNTVGAYAAVIVGASISVGAIIAQNTWAAHLYPWLKAMGWVPGLTSFMDWVTSHTAPWVVWKMNDTKFPINSIEVSFVAMLTGITVYVVGSLLTQKEPFNLERMLHRGQYDTDGDHAVVANREPEPVATASRPRTVYKVALPAAIWLIGIVLWNTLTPWPIRGTRAWFWLITLAATSVGAAASSQWLWKNVISKLLGIDNACTRGDKILIWSVFFFTIVYQMFACFIVVVIWNTISPWPDAWWSHYFYITQLVVPAIIGVISTVWFLWGGVVDTKQLFKDLSARVDNPLDDGRVHGHVSLVDEKASEASENA